MPIGYVLGQVLQIYAFVIIARAIGSYFITNWHQGIPRFLYEATEPVLGPVRRALPPMAGFDLSPMVVVIVIWVVAGYLVRL